MTLDSDENCDVLLMTVIRTRITRRGRGIPEDPVRIIEQYWSTDGKLLAEIDPCPYSVSGSQAMAEQMIRDSR